jgi:hypothetical protein
MPPAAETASGGCSLPAMVRLMMQTGNDVEISVGSNWKRRRTVKLSDPVGPVRRNSWALR